MTNRLELNWKLDGFVDEQRYYCSETPIDLENLPVPKAILAGDVRSYIDTAIETGKTYCVALGSVKNGVEKINDVLMATTHFANNMSGGAETIITINNINYKVHTFTSSGTLNVIELRQPVSLLVVGGGGGGGVWGGAGGGGGGVLIVNELVLDDIGEYSITIGAGGGERTGNGSGIAGSPSMFRSPSNVQIGLANGGAGGGAGGGGGVGGRSGDAYLRGVLTLSGNAGVSSAGAGGGAGGMPVVGGGDGLPFNDTVFLYGAGGGAGGAGIGSNPVNAYLGGISGGGAGRDSYNGSSSTAGLSNSGGGGGGAWGSYKGQNGGGSGIVKVMYRI